MKSNMVAFNWMGFASYAVAIMAALSIYLVLSGRKIPLLGDGRAAFIVVWIMGFAMSILGGFRDYPDGKFTLPGFLLTILMILGFLAIVLFILTLIKVRIPFIPTNKEAFIVLAGIIIIKWAAVHLYKLYNLLI